MNASLYFCHFSISCCWNSVVIGPSSLVMHFPAISNVQHAITDLPSKPILWTIFLLQKLQWRATINHKLVQNKHKWRCPFYSHRYTHFKKLLVKLAHFAALLKKILSYLTIATRGSGASAVILSCLHKTYCHLPLSESKLLDMPLSATINMASLKTSSEKVKKNSQFSTRNLCSHVVIKVWWSFFQFIKSILWIISALDFSQ